MIIFVCYLVSDVSGKGDSEGEMFSRVRGGGKHGNDQAGAE